MRLSLAAAFVSVTLVQQSIAAPSFEASSRGRTLRGQDDNAARPVDEEVLKYFHEPSGDESFAHYDRRYFSGIVSDEERTDTQLHMIRAYLDFFRDRELDTWIAHGTLLGWWWNGKRLPWDVDLDTQVSNATLHHIGEAYNQTKYDYTSANGRVRRKYLLDVNPWIWERVKGNGMNVIDARWIDTRNGLYIDITGLSETRPDTHPGILSCKNNHDYKMTELYPMRKTMFEGVLAKVPYEYDKILTDEYHESALLDMDYNGYYWDESQKEWAKSGERAERDKEAQVRRVAEVRKKALEQKKLEWEASWP